MDVDLAEMVGLVDRGEGKRRVEGVVSLARVMVEERMDVIFFGMVEGQGEWVCVVEGVVET